MIQVGSQARAMWSREDSMEVKWEALHSSLVESGEALLGTVTIKSLDWFQKSVANLKPALHQRNKYYKIGNRDILVKFRQARGKTRRKC